MRGIRTVAAVLLALTVWTTAGCGGGGGGGGGSSPPPPNPQLVPFIGTYTGTWAPLAGGAADAIIYGVAQTTDGVDHPTPAGDISGTFTRASDNRAFPISGHVTATTTGNSAQPVGYQLSIAIDLTSSGGQVQNYTGAMYKSTTNATLFSGGLSQVTSGAPGFPIAVDVTKS